LHKGIGKQDSVKVTKDKQKENDLLKMIELLKTRLQESEALNRKH